MARSLQEKTRRRILEAARLQFGTRGYQQTSVADIAGELSMGHGTFYRYFESKREVLDHVVSEALGKITSAALGRDPSGPRTLAEHAADVDAIGREIYSAFKHDAVGARLVFDEAPAVDAASRARIEAALGQLSAFTAAYLRNGVERGYLRSGLDIEAVAAALTAVLLEGIRHTVRAADPDAEATRWITTYQMLASGLAAR